MVAGARSGGGKTAVSLGLVAALRRRGLRVGVAKVGPDYLDPRLLGWAAGRPAMNLDEYLTGPQGPARSLALAARGADVVIVEGVMGFLDGAPGSTSGNAVASSARIARSLGLSVVLVLDARSSGQTLGAVALGLSVASGIRPLGVVVNRVRSERHAALAMEGVGSVGLEVLGWIGEGELAGLERRHLGLVDPAELPGARGWLERAAATVARRLDLQALLARASHPRLADAELFVSRTRATVAISVGPSARFRYEENLLRLEAAGAELAPFDPLSDVPDPSAQLVWLHGGYPERFLDELRQRRPLFHALRAAWRRGTTLVAECGGYALLARSLEGTPMAGILPVEMRLADRPVLGYRRAALVDGPLGHGSLPAHEFHYLRAAGDGGAIEVTDGLGRSWAQGFASERLLASFLHLHLGARPTLAAEVVERVAHARA